MYLVNRLKFSKLHNNYSLKKHKANFVLDYIFLVNVYGTIRNTFLKWFETGMVTKQKLIEENLKYYQSILNKLHVTYSFDVKMFGLYLNQRSIWPLSC